MEECDEEKLNNTHVLCARHLPRLANKNRARGDSMIGYLAQLMIDIIDRPDLLQYAHSSWTDKRIGHV